VLGQLGPGLVSLRRRSTRTPGLPKATAHDVAWKRNPLLDEEPREDVERTSEGFGWRRLCLVAKHLSDEGEEHSRKADGCELPSNERGRSQSDGSKEKEGRCEKVQRQVEAVSVSGWVDRPLPAEKAKLISTIVRHCFPLTARRRSCSLSEVAVRPPERLGRLRVKARWILNFSWELR
jgi:hypothetical protein